MTKRREFSWKLFMDFIVIPTIVAVLSSLSTLSMTGYSMWEIASEKEQKLSEKYSKAAKNIDKTK